MFTHPHKIQSVKFEFPPCSYLLSAKDTNPINLLIVIRFHTDPISNFSSFKLQTRRRQNYHFVNKKKLVLLHCSAKPYGQGLPKLCLSKEVSGKSVSLKTKTSAVITKSPADREFLISRHHQSSLHPHPHPQSHQGKN